MEKRIKRIIMLLMAAVMFVMMPVCAMAEDDGEATAAPTIEATEDPTIEDDTAASEEPAEGEDAAEETKEDAGVGQKLAETGKITFFGMLGIFAVMIVIYIVISVLNKATK